jgi:arginyl-tRNA synthetase
VDAAQLEGTHVEELKRTLTEELGAAFRRAAAAEGWPAAAMPEVQWEYPPDSAFGDLSTPVSFSLAKLLRRKPREIAAALQRAITADPLLVDRIEVAGAGYLNVFVAKARWRAIIPDVLAAGPAYGRADLGHGRRVQVEFVSANPTGPLHVGHGRGAALGDAVASLLEAVGYRVEREFYINDAGT